MKFEIYQAPFDQTCWAYTATAAYARVWEGEIEPHSTPAATLDALWTSFQRVDPSTGPWPPEGYEGRSLSIGDVVVLDGVPWTPGSPTGWKPAAGFRTAAATAS